MDSRSQAGACERVDAGPLTFEASSEGVTVFDSIERHQRVLHTSASSISRASTEQFAFPVDGAVALETDEVALQQAASVVVHDTEGTTVAEVGHLDERSFQDGEYVIGLTDHLKLYLAVSAPFTVSVGLDGTTISLDKPQPVAVGGRSFHEHPAGTITTGSEPLQMMEAVSYLGSSLKTMSPERSFPTLRGHPPLIEIGDELDIPDNVSKPDTDLTLEVPADYRSIFVAAPLAYYLGADLQPSPSPKLVGPDFEHALDTPRGFEGEVERVLKQTFFLDCVVRTEGLYSLPLHERDQVEPDLDLDFGGLYGADVAERVSAYLDIPYRDVEQHVPEWKQTTHVSPTPDSIELLPFLVDDLAIVRSPSTRSIGDAQLEESAVQDFMRSEEDAEESFTRSAGFGATAPDTVRPATTNSVEQSWVGDGAPVGASKLTMTAFRNRLGRDQADGEVEITVVCNDAEMEGETDLVNEIYADRDDLPFAVNLHRDLTTAELREVLAKRADFFHFIGHIDGEGFKCADGLLDASTLDQVGVDSFFLNACQSYGQGMELIERGAIAGVATVRDVVNRGAETIGVAMARLLDRGFSMNAALEVASTESIMSNRYVVLGDGGFSVTQPESGVPNVCEVERTTDGFELTFRAFPPSHRSMGSIVRPHIEGTEDYFLASGKVETFELSADELEGFLSLSDNPALVDGELRWPEELDVDLV